MFHAHSAIISILLNFQDLMKIPTFVIYQKRWIEMQKKASGISKRLQASRQNPDSLKILTEARKHRKNK